MMYACTLQIDRYIANIVKCLTNVIWYSSRKTSLINLNNAQCNPYDMYFGHMIQYDPDI